MSHDIWDQTYRRDRLSELPAVAVMTVLSDNDKTQRRLVAELQINHRSADDTGSASADLKMTPKQMRALANLLEQHADRIETELIPLLQPEPDLIPFQLYHEPEAA